MNFFFQWEINININFMEFDYIKFQILIHVKTCVSLIRAALNQPAEF